jgi:hypothetical protein
MTFPRACAMAEVCWSPAGKDLNNFLQRLEEHEARLRVIGTPGRPLARRTCLPETSGRILASSADAMIHGTEIVRQSDGSLSGWTDPETIIAWRVESAETGAYRLRVLLKPSATGQASWLEANIAGQVLRTDIRPSATEAELGRLRLAHGSSRLLFLRAGGAPGPEGFAQLRGVELIPDK